jgi:DNA-binding IclR family transcriptional regulator
MPRPNSLARQNSNASIYASLQGLGRAMSVLEGLAKEPMRPKDLATCLNLKWTTAYRTLRYLEEQGYLVRDVASGTYSVGARLYMLGTAYLVRHALALAAQPHLRMAADAMKCAAQGNERHELTVITVEAIDPPAAIPMVSAGFTFPLGIAAKGQLLMAFAPPEVQQRVLTSPLPRFTKYTVTDPEVLQSRLDTIRADGYAVTSQDIQLGVGSVAAPVRDADGSVIGCVSLVVESARMDSESFTAALIRAAQVAANGISLALGWHPKPIAV